MNQKQIILGFLAISLLSVVVATQTNEGKCSDSTDSSTAKCTQAPPRIISDIAAQCSAASGEKCPSNYQKKKSSLIEMDFMPKESFWLNPSYHISPGSNLPEYVTALIEIPEGSRAKFEIDGSGLIKLDRILYTSVHYPSHYGFIPQTMTGDRDPLDILVLCSEKVPPLTLIEARVIGIIQMIDGDEEDDKIIAVAKGDPKYDHVRDMNDVPRHTVIEIEDFFESYKKKIGVEVVLEEFQGKEQAFETMNQAFAYYKHLKATREALITAENKTKGQK